MKRLWWLMPVIVLGLGSCTQQACDQLPVCANPAPNEVQPTGITPGGVDVTAGASSSAEFLIQRTGLPSGDPVVFVPAVVGVAGDASLLARSAEGIEVRGSQGPFTQESVPVSVSVPAGLAAGDYIVYVKLRRVSSRYVGTLGTGVIPVHVH